MKLTRLIQTTALIAGTTLVVTLGANPAVATGTGGGHGHGPKGNADRAIAAYEAMQEHLYTSDGSHLYLERTVPTADDRTYSFEWPFSQAHIATLDLTALPGRAGHQFRDDLADRKVGQERYWNATGGSTGLPGYDSYVRAPYGEGGDMFYDDNEWVALAKVQEYLQTGDRAALSRAKEIFALVASGWDTDPSHASPGGVFWTQAPWSQDRNTVSTFPGAELATRLYLITHQKSYLAWAERSVAWADATLLAPNGLYWDNIKLDGSIDKTQWSYNQGTPIGTYTLLYKATHDRTYLDKAKAIARASLAFYAQDDRLAGQPIFFNSIYFKNLALLESVTGGHTYRDAQQAYADRLWAEVRDPATDLFPVGGTATTLLDQAAAVQVFATLAWPRGQASTLY
ncbi:MAG: glycoside hydrolase family 76 protein [Brevundimonas sp.]